MARAKRLEELARRSFLSQVTPFLGHAMPVLFEQCKGGYAYGHTDNFFEVRVKSDRPLRSEFHKVRFISHDGETLDADLISE